MVLVQQFSDITGSISVHLFLSWLQGGCLEFVLVEVGAGRKRGGVCTREARGTLDPDSCTPQHGHPTARQAGPVRTWLSGLCSEKTRGRRKLGEVSGGPRGWHVQPYLEGSLASKRSSSSLTVCEVLCEALWK